MISLLAAFAVLAGLVFSWRYVQPEPAPAHTPTDELADEVLDTLVRRTPPMVEQPIEEPKHEPEQPPKLFVPDFEIAYAPVRRIEGGYQADPDDRGNYNSKGQLVGTNWGIAAPVAERYFGRPPTKTDMRKLSGLVAKDIYYEVFWRGMHAPRFPTQELADIVFDGHVNHGGWGIKLLQRALGIKEDGSVGPITIAAVRAADPVETFQAYYNLRYDFYHGIVRRRPTQKKFLKGWLRRLKHYYPPKYIGQNLT
ncbi:MAG: glycosyl hydrolase 108 family protein [Bacteroidota bacterium]